MRQPIHIHMSRSIPLFRVEREMDIPGEEDDCNCKTECESEWAELTQECLINILSRLDLHQLWTGAMFVCKPWLRASRDPSLHTKFDLETHFNSATESTLWSQPEFEKKIDSMLRSVIGWSGGALTEIRTRYCSDQAINLVSERCPNLRVLSIKSCPNVTEESISKIASRNLTELDISYCYKISLQSLLIGTTWPNLKIFKRNMMNSVDPSLHVQHSLQGGDTEAAIIGKNMPNLKHLEIRFSKLTAKGLASIYNSCLELEHFDLYGCKNLTSRDIANASSNLNNLREIIEPDFYSMLQPERYGHWSLYEERFQTDVFRI